MPRSDALATAVGLSLGVLGPGIQAAEITAGRFGERDHVVEVNGGAFRFRKEAPAAQLA